MLKLTFKQTNSELLVRAAASVLFGTLARLGAKIVRISDLAEKPQYGFTASAATEPVGPRFVRITDLQDGRIDWETVPFCECTEPDKYLLRGDDLLFARTGATTGKTHLVREPERAVFASYLIRLRPKAGVFSGYLHAFFQSDNYWSQISEEKEGSAQPNVNGEKLAALEIPLIDSKLQHAIAEFLRCVRSRQDGDKIDLPELPAPLAEQRRVVARIEELAAQIHEARTFRHQATEEAEAISSSWINAAFSRIPRENTMKLGEVAEIIGGGTLPDVTGAETGNEVLLVKVSDMNRPGNETHISESAVGLPASSHLLRGSRILPKSSIVFPKRGGAIATNKKRVLLRPAVLDPNMMGVYSRNEEQLTPAFLFKWFSSVDLASLQNGTSVPQINKGDFEPLAIPIPNKPEQRRIVAELDALQAEVDALKRLQAETAAKLDALLPALLDRAFKGEL